MDAAAYRKFACAVRQYAAAVDESEITKGGSMTFRAWGYQSEKIFTRPTWSFLT